jgi:hypothetical protein
VRTQACDDGVAMAAPPIPNLHDAILQRVVVDWPAATASIECGTAADTRTVLVVQHVREVRVDKRQPWGPSQSINSVYVDESSAGEVALYIEVQSRDDILIVGRALEIQDA